MVIVDRTRNCDCSLAVRFKIEPNIFVLVKFQSTINGNGSTKKRSIWNRQMISPTMKRVNRLTFICMKQRNKKTEVKIFGLWYDYLWCYNNGNTLPHDPGSSFVLNCCSLQLCPCSSFRRIIGAAIDSLPNVYSDSVLCNIFFFLVKLTAHSLDSMCTFD